jgi:hypothetical protein
MQANRMRRNRGLTINSHLQGIIVKRKKEKKKTCTSSSSAGDLHIGVQIRLDGRNARLPPTEDVDEALIAGADAPLAVGTPVELPDGRALPQHLDSLVSSDRPEGVAYSTVVQGLLRLFYFEFTSARTGARGRRGVRGGAAFADVTRYMGRQDPRGRVACVGFFEALQVPEEDFALLISGHENGMAAHLVEYVEAHVEDVGLG